MWWYRRKTLSILLMFAIGLVLYFGNSIHALLLDGFRPVMYSFTKMGYVVGDVLDVFLHSSRRAEEIRQLRLKNQILETERVFGENIKRENEELRAVLGRTEDRTKLVYARVVGHSSSRVDDFLVVDAGEREGVKKDMPVLVAEGTIQIGTIADVASHTSVVRLLSHVGEKISVSLPESGVLSVATGQGAGVLEIQVPASIPVRKGEPLFSVGPPDYMLGYIEQIEKSDAGPFQIARLSHPITLTDVRRVYIVISVSYE
ncbi:MAG: hypothetical protein A2719_02850 [Candidatus Ryanbacteria bacterium RIFCSPHIGHO2_01_FULL_45_22]|uniref:Cell shape-determining protein MreC n=1 Tax=Candidatus Ryanbacteria bacterium RIFCSPHIGHO2_01_FULL_45_22 TaxID=1802114 RepID=A0A1G2G197_9BACT|nr:MAG: hypothetical protein A2719_02850 [Candidatus Ryanbacteria bacterium RIFCSPHIGHO2_01_FULL_45_22]